MKLRPETIALAREMLVELRQSHRRVVLVPAPRPRHPTHKIRIVEEELPAWYLRLLHLRTFTRRHNNGTTREQSYHQRRWVLRSLERIANGEAMPRWDSIDADVLKIIEREALENQVDNAG